MSATAGPGITTGNGDVDAWDRAAPDARAAASMPPTARLWLVRHAAPLVAAGTCYGALDIPADGAATYDAAQRLHAALAPVAPRAQVVCSTLQRCEQLAHVLKALQPDLTLQFDPRLCEMDFGAWEGQSWSTIPQREIDAWTAAFATYAPGGGEPLAAMLARVSAALQSARALARRGAVTDVVWITHAGVARCVDWLLAHDDGDCDCDGDGDGDGVMPLSHQWPRAAPDWGHWVVRPLA